MRLPGVKARIVAALRSNGECDAEWLFHYVFDRRKPNGQWKRRPKRHNLAVHIYQLRKMGYPITAIGRGPHAGRWEWSDETPGEGR